MARASEYSEEIADSICARIAEGESLRQICRDEGAPSKSTVMRWLSEQPTFQDQYARAREAQADHFGDEILEIADDGRNDYVMRLGEDGGGVAVDHDHIARSRLRVDARKWLMSKIAPKKYGEKLDLEHSGSVKVERVERRIVDPGHTDR